MLQRRFALGFLLLVILPLLQAQDNLIEVRRGVESVPFLFVSEFDGDSTAEHRKLIREIFSKDLSSTGEVNIVDVPGASVILGREPDFERFSRASLDYAVGARIKPTAAGGLELDFVLYSTSTTTIDLQQTLSVRTVDSARNLAHRFANEVYEFLTKRKGAFDTFIAYVRETIEEGEPRFEILVSDADGYGARQVFSSRYPLSGLAWSHNNRSLAYTSWDKGYPTVYVQELATGNRSEIPRRLGVNSDASFSPDGRSLVLVQSRGFNPDVYVVNLTTRRAERLAGLNAVEASPRYSADGNRVIFTSDRSGSPQLYEIDADGRNERRITFQGNYNADGIYLPSSLQVVAVVGDGRGFRIGLIDMGSFRLQHISDRHAEIDGITMSPNGAVVLYSHATSGGSWRVSGVSTNGQAKFQLINPGGGKIYSPAWSWYTSE